MNLLLFPSFFGDLVLSSFVSLAGIRFGLVWFGLGLGEGRACIPTYPSFLTLFVMVFFFTKD